jgi:FKBP-type peptidyl-prolyl cis-trans isomerase FkpA
MAQREKRNRRKGSAGNNRKASADFLERNKSKPGVIIAPSGLQYQIVENTSGSFPTENSIITVHQRCWLINGNVIEDTYKENKPSEISVKELIDGYQEGILLMPKGSRFRFFIPPDLAWGKKGTGSKIPPNAVLIFDVRLIDFW